jgi:NADPH:quinone reductase-like Zn-dependent oxidoreductase
MLAALCVCFVAVVFHFFFLPHLFPELHNPLGGSSWQEGVVGKTVLVTGASLGIGRSLVEEYAREGASEIVMAARSVDKMEATRAQIYAQGITTPERTKIHIIKADLSTKAASEQCVADALHVLADRGLDYLILNHITNSRFGTWLSDNVQLPGGHDFVPEVRVCLCVCSVYICVCLCVSVCLYV